jgi:hypothetical protein
MGKRKQADPNQLRMFMSAHEIMQSHAPNEPDRLWHGTRFGVREAMGGAYAREETAGFGRQTQRSSRTDGGINFVHPEGGYSRAPKRTKAPPETDEQLYSRKRTEAEETGLATSIAQHGVQVPIALGQTESPSGRPSLAGGHHRVAVMAHLSPDQLLPVTHVADVLEAKKLKL